MGCSIVWAHQRSPVLFPQRLILRETVYFYACVGEGGVGPGGWTAEVSRPSHPTTSVGCGHSLLHYSYVCRRRWSWPWDWPTELGRSSHPTTSVGCGHSLLRSFRVTTPLHLCL